MELGHAELIRRLDAAVAADSVEAITARVKATLEDVLGHAALTLPAHFHETCAESYARRLLHQDPHGRYTAVVMTWGPGQATPVHDHGGLWCVEGVVEGEMTVTQFAVAPGADDTFSVHPSAPPVRAGIGTAGRLIPPTDYHVLGNARPDRASITLHVYGGSLETCRIFLPLPDGRYQQQVRHLSYST